MNIFVGSKIITLMGYKGNYKFSINNEEIIKTNHKFRLKSFQQENFKYP